MQKSRLAWTMVLRPPLATCPCNPSGTAYYVGLQLGELIFVFVGDPKASGISSQVPKMTGPNLVRSC